MFRIEIVEETKKSVFILRLYFPKIGNVAGKSANRKEKESPEGLGPSANFTIDYIFMF